MSDLTRVTLFGSVTFQDGERSVGKFRTQRARMLLAFLAVHAGKNVSRETLIDTLWPDVDETTGRNRLSTELSFLRSTLQGADGDPTKYILADRSSVWLRPDKVTTDLQEFWACIKSARDRNQRLSSRTGSFRRALEIHSAPLLADLHEEWVYSEQALVSEAITASTLEVSSALEALRGSTAMIPVLQAAIEVEPTCEILTAALLKAYQAAGWSDEARAAFRKYETLAESELGVAPPKEWARFVAPPKVVPKPSRFDSIWHGDRGKSAFVGRTKELDRLVQVLSPREPDRLVTLVALGGFGKSRLAEAAALAEAVEGRDIVAVDLTKVSDRQGMLSEIVRRSGGSSTSPEVDHVAALLVERTALLVLDNFEHLDATCAQAVGQLLDLVPDLKVLVTSRLALKLDSELVIQLDPLPMPGPETPESSPAVQLFIDRARRVRPDFVATSRELTGIREICSRLEGVPLSIELAASRVGVLSPSQIAAELASPFRLLQLPRGEGRHAAIRSVIEWSYRSLSDEAKRCFRLSSVFHGGFDYEAAKIVFGGESCLDLLDELISASFLTAQDNAYQMRYRLLETVRELAQELVSPEELTEAKQRHTEYFIGLARRHEHSLRSSNCIESFNQLTVDVYNLLATLRALGPSKEGFDMLRALRPFWVYRDYLAEIWALYSKTGSGSANRFETWTKAACALLPSAPKVDTVQARAFITRILLNEGARLLDQDDRALATAFIHSPELTQILESSLIDDDFPGHSSFTRCLTLGEQARSLFFEGNCRKGLDTALMALARGRESGCPWLTLEVQDRVIWFAHHCSKFALARSSLREYCELSMAVRGQDFAPPHQYEGSLELMAGRIAEAADAYERFRVWSSRLSQPLYVAAAYSGLARTALFNEQFDEALRFENCALKERAMVGLDEFVSYSFRGLAAIALARGQAEEGLALACHALDLVSPFPGEFAINATKFEKGRCLIALRRVEEGAALLRSCLETWVRFDSDWFLADCLDACAICEVARCNFEQAAKIVGGAAYIREKIDVPPLPLQAKTISTVVAQVQAEYGKANTDALIAEGRLVGPLKSFRF